MWKVRFIDIKPPHRELSAPETTKDSALRPACAFRKQHGRENVWVVNPDGRELPIEEIDAFCGGLPP